MPYTPKAHTNYGKTSPKVGYRLNQMNMALGTGRVQPQSVQLSQAIQSNISGLTLFLSKFLSGANNIVISPSRTSSGYSVGRKLMNNGAIIYDIHVPHWQTYTLPLPDRDKYRVYRNGVWHEAMHIKYTPEEVYTFGTDPSNPEALKEPLAHDMINIIEDRGIEDIGEKDWVGAKGERLFCNAYAWTRRMDCGEFFNLFLDKFYDKQKGDFIFPDVATEKIVRTRLAHMRHEAFLQRLLVKKIKGYTHLPAKEVEVINKEVKLVEEQLEKLEPFRKDLSKNHQKIFYALAAASLHVIRDLDLKWYTPDIKKFGESSWDQSFNSAPINPGDQQKTRAGIDDYFDELMAVEVICSDCKQHYTKKLGVRV